MHSRTNAPLLVLRLQLVKRGIPCHMLGRKELSRELKSLVAQTGATDIAALCKALDDYVNPASRDEVEQRIGGDEEAAEAAEEGEESVIAGERVDLDLADALLHLIEHVRSSQPGGGSLDLWKRLQAEIERFSAGDDDDARPGSKVVKLSTVHKAKGLG